MDERAVHLFATDILFHYEKQGEAPDEKMLETFY